MPKVTAEHVALLKQQEIASGRDVERFRELEPLIDAAGDLRQVASDAIRKHLDHGA